MRLPTRMRSKDLHTSALELLIQCLGGHDEIDLRRAIYLHVAGILILTPAAREMSIYQYCTTHPVLGPWAVVMWCYGV